MRLFPGVPPAWTIARLAALALGSLLVASGLDAGREGRAGEYKPLRSVTDFSFRVMSAAGLAALAALAMATAARRLPALAGFLVLALPFVPALILFVSDRSRAEPDGRERPVSNATWIVIAGWFAWRVPAAVGSPRTASVVDAWPVFEWLSAASASGANPLAARTAPGVSDGFMFLLGGPILPTDPPSLLVTIQIVHCLWIVLAAWAVARLAAMWIRDEIAPVAAAAFLFSPMVLFMPYSPSPFGIFTAIGTCAALALSSLVRNGTAAAGLALAALAGTAAMSAHMWLPVAVIAGGGLWYLWRQRERVRPPDLALAVACSAAAALPHLPGPSAVRAMIGQYVEARGHWALLEQTVFGQRSPFGDGGLDGLWTSASPQAFDVAAGALLAPWAVARTSLRLWGDVLFDPVSTALAGCALVLCMRALTPASFPRRAALAALSVALLPAALTSSYDVPSVMRAILLPVPMALLAALGCAALARRTAYCSLDVVAAIGAAVIAVSGAALFDGANRRILASSSLELAVETFAAPEPVHTGIPEERNRALVLDFQRPNVLPWLHTATIAGALAPASITVRGYEGRSSLFAGIDEPIAAAYAWSPGLEEHERIAETFCGIWPAASVHRIFDTAGRSSLFVGVPPGSNAARRIAPARAVRVGCGGNHSTGRPLNAERPDG
jgi:hypothetical protein